MPGVAATGSGASSWRSCPCCGLIQRVPPIPPAMRARCARCRTTIRGAPAGGGARAPSRSRTVAIAAAALILYPLAVTLPILQIERFGHLRASSILDGIATLLASDHLLVGLVVLCCSLLFPLGKLLALLALSAGETVITRRHHRAWTYRLIEWTGRWGMLDVLLVAVLVAALKLGDTVDVQPGPGALAFATVVVLSLLASASFDPHGIWEEEGEP